MDTAAPTGTRLVYRFDEGNRDQRDLLGGKGANLAEMTRLGLPVPPGFIVTTEACRAYLRSGEVMPDGLLDEMGAALSDLESTAGKRLGDTADPLLVSVRSGAPFSMPGMMDTVLNVGLNDETVTALAAATGDERFAWDAYRRLLQLFGKVVLGVAGDRFEEALEAAMRDSGVDNDTALPAERLRTLVAEFSRVIEAEAGQPFPQDPRRQLEQAVEAVFRSWNGRRAKDYRRMEGISDDLGTAVNVQVMVFGNLGDESGTGVAFTRDPATGEAVPYGDWLDRAQGEDVVAGIRTTEHLDALAERFPRCSTELHDVMGALERHYRDLCDIEFTIERGTLYILQTRVGKRTAQAAVRCAVEMVGEGLIESREAVARVTPEQIERLLHPQFAPDATFRPLTTGLNASPGAATGAVCFSADEAVERRQAGERLILVRTETSPEDLHGMIAADGILTSRGGLVSHAAVVARGMGKPAVVGADEVVVDIDAGTFTVGDTVVGRGDVISLDGGTGTVVAGAVPVFVPEPSGTLGQLLTWADEARTLGVRANADTPEDARRAVAYGAEGIGLCRTEHMFLGERLPVVREIILAEDPAAETAALEELQRLQREDFAGMLTALEGRPLTVRLLDPPLHEFLPDATELEIELALGKLDAAGERLLEGVRAWQEQNPMLGIRGCRLGVLKPELYEMQVRALVEAALEVRRSGVEPVVEIMIPLIVTARELQAMRRLVTRTAEQVLGERGETLRYEVGTMIETPRAALTAGHIAESADFFSFGTNDLTQMTFGFSRDDVEAKMMPLYLDYGLLDADPFGILDRNGVGRLIEIAVAEGKAAKPGLTAGVCGEHGGDPDSIRTCHDLGLDYVSCSPFRLPVARLAAAHAALGLGGPGASA